MCGEKSKSQRSKLSPNISFMVAITILGLKFFMPEWKLYNIYFFHLRSIPPAFFFFFFVRLRISSFRESVFLSFETMSPDALLHIVHTMHKTSLALKTKTDQNS